MEEFLEFIHNNAVGGNPYETHSYVSFRRLKEDGGFSEEKIFSYIEEAKEEDLIYDSNIYQQQKVALSSKGKYYVKNLL
jgi:hypothetical protein